MRTLALLITLALPAAASAQTENTEAPVDAEAPTTPSADVQTALDAPADEDLELAAEDDGRTFIVVPGVAYSQETSLIIAAFASYTFPIAGTGEATWPSTIRAAAVYTLENQASASLWTTFYLGRANDWAIDTEAFVEHFPNNYYGIGGDADPNYQLYTRRRFQTNNTVRRRVAGELYLGLAHHLSAYAVRDVEGPFDTDGEPTDRWTGDDQLGAGRVPGEDGDLVHGLGGVIRWDRRDNDQSATRGLLFDLEVAHYAPELGGDTRFTQGVLDMRGYVPIGRVVVAGQWRTEIAEGEVPFVSMATLGGDMLLRGMYEGRFRDQSAMAGQLEVRAPIYRRFGGVAFASAGQTFGELEDIDALWATGPRWSAGAGVRYLLDPANRSTIRFDYGAGPDGAGAILTFAEAF